MLTRTHDDGNLLRQFQGKEMLGVFADLGRVFVPPLGKQHIALLDVPIAQLRRGHLDTGLFAQLAYRRGHGRGVGPFHAAGDGLPKLRVVGAPQQQHLAGAGIYHHEHRFGPFVGAVIGHAWVVLNGLGLEGYGSKQSRPQSCPRACAA